MIIGVHVVVYTVCKCARRFNPKPIHIEGVDFAKVLGGFLWIWCSWSVDWFRQSSIFFCKIAVSRVCVDIIKLQGVFYKIGIHKVWRFFFAKLSSIDRELISPKFKGFFFQNLRPQLFLGVGSDDLTTEEFWPTWPPSSAWKCTRFGYKRCILHACLVA